MKKFLFSILTLFMIAPAAVACDINPPPPAIGHLSTEGCRLSMDDKCTPVPPRDLAAVFDLSYGEIYLVWTQNDDVPVCYWRVYYSLTSGGPNHKLGRADNDNRSLQAFSPTGSGVARRRGSHLLGGRVFPYRCDLQPPEPEGGLDSGPQPGAAGVC